MLVELRVRNLGVIDDLVLQLGPGMTALTGETGAGKTLVVEALELLMGGRADQSLVRAGTEVAVVEGRFVSGETGEEEIVVSREVPADGRSRAYVNGNMATASSLAETGVSLVDLHGQHAHQSLLHQATQRQALDRYAGISTEAVDQAADEAKATARRLAELGGDERALARELDLLRYQLDELETARLEDPHEDEALRDEEAVLAGAEALRTAANAVTAALADDRGARDLVAEARQALGGYQPLADLAERLAAAETDLDDIATEARARAESFEDDPARLADVQERRRLLGELQRKYGASLEAVITYREEARTRLDDLEAGETRRAEIGLELEAAKGRLRSEQAKLGEARRAAAPRLAKEIERRLRSLALPQARIEIEVSGKDPGDEVEFLFVANAGERPLPLAKSASGGELARAMLATRLVLSEAPPTLVFDEVDAGVGGEAALSVGRALAEVGERHQVLVVTHLAQVAAFASCQIAVEKRSTSTRTITTARPVSGEERLAELSRMLSGRPGSESGRKHARDLLDEIAAAHTSAGARRRSGTLSERTPGRTA